MITFIFMLFIGATMNAVPESLIKTITLEHNTITVTACDDFQHTFMREPFFAEYDTAIDLNSLDFTIVTIPFLLNVLPVIWASDKTYTIESMDEELHAAAQRIKKVLQAFYPSSSWQGELIPLTLMKNRLKNKQFDCATLFSGGLDATYTALAHHDQNQLLITFWGGDICLSRSEQWHQVKKMTHQFAQLHNQSSTWVRSNFKNFLERSVVDHLCPDVTYWWAYVGQSLGYVGLTAPILSSYGIDTLYIGSSHTKEFPYPYGSHPLIDNAIACAGSKTYHDGDQLTRVGKIAAIQQLCQAQKKSYPFLRVCWGHHPLGDNCLRCEKCLRTAVELVIAGQQPHAWGFNIPFPRLIQLAQERASQAHTDPIINYHWYCIAQDVRQSSLKYHRIFDRPTTQFLHWLATTYNPSLYKHKGYALLSELWQNHRETSYDEQRINRIKQELKKE